jgi:hypothetical protein
MGIKTPKKVVNALMPPALRVACIDGTHQAVAPFTLARCVLLQKLEHPIVLGGAIKGGKVLLSHEQTLQMLFVLTNPVAEVQRLIDESDEAFHAAVIEMADRFAMAELGNIRAQVLESFARAWETGLATTPAGQKKTTS